MENPGRDREILDVIGIISASGESGMLRVTAGMRDGVLFFKDGKVVDARVGDLTGFRAINAVASLRDAHFKFDRTAIPPAFSSITPNERTVLKEFFGIETIAPPFADEGEEATLIRTEAPVAETPVAAPVAESPMAVPVAETPVAVPLAATPVAVPVAETPVAIPQSSSSRYFYRTGFIFAALIAVAIMTFAFVYKFRTGVSPAPASVAAAVESSSPQPISPEPAAQVQPSEQPAAPVQRIEQPAAPVQPSEQPAAPVQPIEQPVAQVQPSEQSAAVAHNLSGKWNVVNTVQKTSYGSFKNLQIGFNLSIDQNGKSFTGQGEKVSENGRSLPEISRTPIQVKGLINGDKVEATFSEEGSRRKTDGRFVWRIDKAGRLTGTFASSAASSSGKSAAKKL